MIDTQAFITKLSDDLNLSQLFMKEVFKEHDLARIEIKLPGMSRSSVTVTLFSTSVTCHEYAVNYRHESGDFEYNVATASYGRMCFDVGAMINKALTREEQDYLRTVA